MFPDYTHAIRHHLDIIECLRQLMGQSHGAEAAERARVEYEGAGGARLIPLNHG